MCHSDVEPKPYLKVTLLSVCPTIFNIVVTVCLSWLHVCGVQCTLGGHFFIWAALKVVLTATTGRTLGLASILLWIFPESHLIVSPSEPQHKYQLQLQIFD